MFQRSNLQRFVWEKTLTAILAEIMIFAIEMTYLNALLSFLLSSCFSARSVAI